MQEQLHAGNSYEVNLTYRLETVSDLDPLAAYLRLRTVNPAPYAGYLQHDVPGHRAWLLSSSPERYALVTADRVLETKPIKGTTPRGATPEEDEAARHRLATDPKFRSENLMIVDLLRNDLSMVCEPGTVEVPVLMDVESYPSVHQLVSTVRGRLVDGVSTVQALRALFPAGSMTGAPKLRTMQVIEEVEGSPRGVYAGAFGWLTADGRADLGVVIRSLTTTGDGTYRLGTGGGITVRSDVEEEYAESRWKAERLLAALGSPQSVRGVPRQHQLRQPDPDPLGALEVPDREHHGVGDEALLDEDRDQVVLGLEDDLRVVGAGDVDRVVGQPVDAEVQAEHRVERPRVGRRPDLQERRVHVHLGRHVAAVERARGQLALDLAGGDLLAERLAGRPSRHQVARVLEVGRGVRADVV